MALPPKLRTILACLLINSNQVFSNDRIIDELWPVASPHTGLATIQTYIYQLRKLLAAARRPDGESPEIITERLGYRLMVPREQIDVFSFESCLHAGQEAFAAGEYEHAARGLRTALSFWKGTLLSDVPKGDLLTAFVAQLEEGRIQAHELLADSNLRLERHLDVIRDLKALTIAHPLHEGFHAKLMLALVRSGRRHEALDIYTTLRKTLVAELGIEPSRPVRDLHQAALSEDAPLLSAHHARVVMQREDVARPETPVPAQLEGDIADFTGHAEQLAQADELLGSQAANSPTIVSVLGRPGSGKTAFALRAAHQRRATYPDGQFFAKLRRNSTSLHPYVVLGEFLAAIGVPGERIPDTLETRSQLFRSWCADRQVLVVLDGASAVEQVRPLLPGGIKCAVLITSDCALHGINGVIVDLPPLRLPDAMELLSSTIGRRFNAEERAAALMLVNLCERLPLALRAFGERIASLRLPLDRAVQLLSDEDLRLVSLSCGELDLQASFDRSYRTLRPESRDALAKLAGDGASTWSLREALALISPSSHYAELILNDIVDRHFLDVDASAGTPICQLPELSRFFLLSKQIPSVFCLADAVAYS